MSSLQQNTVKAKAVPPPVIAGGVSKQQIDAAVKEHVRKAKAAPATDMRISRAKSELAMTSAFVDGWALSQEKALAVAISLRNNLEEAGENVCDTDVHLASIVVDILGVAVNEINLRKHLKAADELLSAEVTA